MINERLKEMMKVRGVTQKALVEMIGSSQATMSHNLNQAEPPLDFVRKVCTALKEPLYKAILSPAEIESMQGISPEIAPIVSELSRVAAERKPAERELLFKAIMGLLDAV